MRQSIYKSITNSFKRAKHHLLNILNIIELFIFNLLFHIDGIGHNPNKGIFFNYEKKTNKKFDIIIFKKKCRLIQRNEKVIADFGKNDKYETLIVLNAEENAEYCIVLNQFQHLLKDVFLFQ